MTPIPAAPEGWCGPRRHQRRVEHDGHARAGLLGEASSRDAAAGREPSRGPGGAPRVSVRPRCDAAVIVCLFWLLFFFSKGENVHAREREAAFTRVLGWNQRSIMERRLGSCPVAGRGRTSAISFVALPCRPLGRSAEPVVTCCWADETPVRFPFRPYTACHCSSRSARAAMSVSARGGKRQQPRVGTRHPVHFFLAFVRCAFGGWIGARDVLVHGD